MIDIIELKELLELAQIEINQKAQYGEIGAVLLCVNEAQAVRTLKDRPGIVMLCRYPQTDSEITNPDNYAEQNKELVYIIERWTPGKYTAEQEIDRYAYLKTLMSELKYYLLEELKLTGYEVEEGFHTEFEYDEFGGWNGLSITFGIKDWEL